MKKTIKFHYMKHWPSKKKRKKKSALILKGCKCSCKTNYSTCLTLYVEEKYIAPSMHQAGHMFCGSTRARCEYTQEVMAVSTEPSVQLLISCLCAAGLEGAAISCLSCIISCNASTTAAHRHLWQEIDALLLQRLTLFPRKDEFSSPLK